MRRDRAGKPAVLTAPPLAAAGNAPVAELLTWRRRARAGRPPLLTTPRLAAAWHAPVAEPALGAGIRVALHEAPSHAPYRNDPFQHGDRRQRLAQDEVGAAIASLGD